MNKFEIRLDEPKQKFDKEESRDFMDEIFRNIDKLEKTVMELEEGNQQSILLIDIKSRQLREALKENEELKLKIKMLERG